METLRLRGVNLSKAVKLVNNKFSFFFFRAALTAYGGYQAVGQIGAVAAGLHQSHSNLGLELCLSPIP